MRPAPLAETEEQATALIRRFAKDLTDRLDSTQPDRLAVVRADSPTLEAAAPTP